MLDTRYGQGYDNAKDRAKKAKNQIEKLKKA